MHKAKCGWLSKSVSCSPAQAASRTKKTWSSANKSASANNVPASASYNATGKNCSASNIVNKYNSCREASTRSLHIRLRHRCMPCSGGHRVTQNCASKHMAHISTSASASCLGRQAEASLACPTELPAVATHVWCCHTQHTTCGCVHAGSVGQALD